MKTFLRLSHLNNLGLALLGVLLLAAACARTPPVTYYHLSTVDPGKPNIPAPPLGEAIIGIGPVQLPEYLDRPQIVNREGANQLQLAEGDRWAEPLTVSIPRTIRENLAAALGTEQFLIFPWGEAVDYQVVIEIVRFEGEGYRMAQLEAIWSIQDSQGTVILPSRRSDYQEPVTRAGSEGLVQALSQALASFSREIARQLSEKAAKK